MFENMMNMFSSSGEKKPEGTNSWFSSGQQEQVASTNAVGGRRKRKTRKGRKCKKSRRGTKRWY